MPAGAPAAYGPGQQVGPMQNAEAEPPTAADILQPQLEQPNNVEHDEAENGQDDDYLDDQFEMGDAYHEIGFANLEWWDTVPWERVLLQGAPTTAMIPDSMAAAGANLPRPRTGPRGLGRHATPDGGAAMEGVRCPRRPPLQ